MKTKVISWVKDLVKKHHESCRGKSLEFVLHEVDPSGGYKAHDGDLWKYDSIAEMMIGMKEGYIDTWILARHGWSDWDLDLNAHFPDGPIYFNVDKIINKEQVK